MTPSVYLMAPTQPQGWAGRFGGGRQWVWSTARTDTGPWQFLGFLGHERGIAGAAHRDFPAPDPHARAPWAGADSGLLSLLANWRALLRP